MFTFTSIKRGFGEVSALFDEIEGRGFICGGYARYCASPLLSPVEAGDVDVYCYTVEDYEVLKDRLLFQFQEISYETDRAVTFKRISSGVLAYTPEVQLVKPVTKFRLHTVGSKEDILSNFDFTICRAAISSRTQALVDVDFERDEANKVLKLRNIHCPISSTLRCVKYANRGYSLRPYDILPLFLDWDQRDESYRKELIEGLTELQKSIDAQERMDADRLTALYDLISID